MNEPVVVDGLAALELAAPQDAAAAVYDQPIGSACFREPRLG